MKSIYLSSVAIFATTMMNISTVFAAVPAIEIIGRSAIVTCPTTLNVPTVYHSDKVIFEIGQNELIAPTGASATTIDALKKLPRLTPLDIKIQDDPKKIAHLKRKVITFLGAADIPTNADNIQIKEVEYTAVICPKTSTVP